jgi:hypothetical protein
MAQFGLAEKFMRFGEDNASFWEQGVLVFFKALGAFEPPPTGTERVSGFILMLMFLMLVTNLIGLNSLIAILGDSFDKVMNAQKLYDLREKNVILLELNEFFRKWNKDKEDFKHIHVIRYVSQEGDSGNVWDGKV